MVKTEEVAEEKEKGKEEAKEEKKEEAKEEKKEEAKEEKKEEKEEAKEDHPPYEFGEPFHGPAAELNISNSNFNWPFGLNSPPYKPRVPHRPPGRLLISIENSHRQIQILSNSICTNFIIDSVVF
ncbi:hypothetical protein GJ744_006014 [Endocarpon pusillum]|uniref:Uncharacterized protein n=1 Tax=Endocarpon pusillum TaxID=364733 RepID=A0A8H7A714_9EURO|nr:hypothetical protein GJ744_006014 [Endocarpon pusillum]